MSAKLTVIFFILICFEIGVLLIYLPWHRPWTENHLLILAVDKFHWTWLARFMMSGYLRGAVTGLGILNMMLGVREFLNFKKTVRALESGWQGEQYPGPLAPSGLPDNGPAPARRIQP